ncbi:MAG TPA: DUF2849 domain-containing protein [Gammaproteobacteria bacterium]
MIVASRLADGAVVFFTAAEGWTPSIDAGVVIDDDAEAERLLAVAQTHQARQVVEPYLIEVTLEDGRPRPIAIREAIRAFGPTIRTDLDKYE